MRTDTLREIDTLLDYLLRVTAMVRSDNQEALTFINTDHVGLVRHYDQVRRTAGKIKEAREAINEMEDRLSKESIPEAFRAAKVKTTTIEGVGRVTVSYRYSCTMLDKTAGLDYIRSIDQAELIQETVNSSTLSAFAKNLLEVEGKELPPEIFKVGTSPYTSITKV